MNHIAPMHEPAFRDIPLCRLALAPENVRKTPPDEAAELLDAYRGGQMDLETLMAFIVTTDRDRQRAVWERVSGQGYRPSAWQVKRMLTEERVPAGAPPARFVGVAVYEDRDCRRHPPRERLGGLALPAPRRLRACAGDARRWRGARTPRLSRRRAPCRALAGARVRRVRPREQTEHLGREVYLVLS